MKISDIYKGIDELNPNTDANKENMFYVDCDKIIKYIVIHNKELDNHGSVLFINKIIKYISSDDKNIKPGFDFLDRITKKKYLKSYNLSAVIECIKNNKHYDPRWLHNLINLYVYISREEFTVLEHCGYGNIHNILINCKIIDHNVINYLLEDVNYDLGKIHGFLELSQLNDWNIILSQKYDINITNLTKLFLKSSDEIKIKLLNTLIKTMNFRKHINLSKIVKRINKFSWSSLHIDDFTQLISNNVSFILEKHHKCTIGFIKKSMFPLSYCEFDYDIILTRMLDHIDDKNDLCELLEESCLHRNHSNVEIVHKKLNFVTKKALLNACSIISSIVTYLINNKALLDVDCIKVIDTRFDRIFRQNFLSSLVDYGLPVNHETIIESMKKGLFVMNLEEYNYIPNDEFYALCIKLEIIPSRYVKLLESYNFNISSFEKKNGKIKNYDRILFDDNAPGY